MKLKLKSILEFLRQSPRSLIRYQMSLRINLKKKEEIPKWVV